MERRHDRQRLDRREFSARRFSRSCAALRAGRSVHSRGASDLGFVGRRRHRVIYRQRVLVRSNRGTASRPFDVSVRDLTRGDVAAQPPGTSGHFPGRDSPTGRDFAAANADVIFSRHGTHFDDALAFATDIRARLLAAGRPADDIRILPGTQIVLAEKASEVEEKRRWVLEGQYTGQTALSLVGLVWGRDLSDRDPDGPLPEFDPVPAPIRPPAARRGTARTRSPSRRSGVRSRRPRTCLCAKLPSKPQSAPALWARRSRSQTKLARWVRAGATDGFNISPYIVPGGLDEIVDWLVPALQERGVYRTEYASTTLRGHLGLREPLTRRHSDETDSSATG